MKVKKYIDFLISVTVVLSPARGIMVALKNNINKT